MANNIGYTGLVFNSVFNYLDSAIETAGWKVEPFPSLVFYDADQEYDVIEASLPAMSLEFARIDDSPFEMGNRDTKVFRYLELDIFTEFENQAWALLDLLNNLLKNVTIDLMDYNLATPVSVGYITFNDVRANKIFSAAHSATAKNHYVIRFSAETIE